LRCLGCGTCTKSCPQDIDVKGYMALLMRGDIAGAADKSFDCIMCGLCAARCPAEESQYNYAILARRLYGRNLSPRSQHLADRLTEIERGEFKEAIQALRSADKESLKKQYAERDIEPE
jgi:ferredoxin